MLKKQKENNWQHRGSEGIFRLKVKQILEAKVVAHKVNAKMQCGHKLILSQFAQPVWVENV